MVNTYFGYDLWLCMMALYPLTPTRGATQQSVDCESLTPTQAATQQSMDCKPLTPTHIHI